MNIKALIVISILFLIPNLSCEKRGDLIDMHFFETKCSNPWSINNSDPDYKNKVKSFLEQQGINIKTISITNDGPASDCESCGCTTGRTINITVYDENKTLALNLRFFQ